MLSLSVPMIGNGKPLRNSHYTVLTVLLAFIIILPSYTAENRNGTQAVLKPELRLGSTEIFRGNSALISLYPGENDTGQHSCTIEYSRDGNVWKEIPAMYKEDHFEADFITSHATPLGDAFFRGMVTNRSTSEASEWSDTATLNIRNNPPVAFLAVPEARGVIGGEVLLSGAGSYDVDGTISSYTWFLDGMELGTSTSESKMSYNVTYEKKGWVNFTLEVTDNEGGTSISAPVPIEIVKNTVRSSNVTFYSLDSRRQIMDDEKWEGTVRIEGNITDLLGFGNVEINIRERGGEPFINKKLTYGINTSGAMGITWEKRIEGIHTYWFYYLDTTTMKNGKYNVEIKAENGATTVQIGRGFEVMNGPSPRETHFPPFISVGLGIFMIFAIIGFVISWYDNKIQEKKLENIGYRPSDVFKHIPLASRISFAISAVLLVLLLLITAWFMENWLLFVIMCAAMGITGVSAHRVFSGRSKIMAIVGGLFACASGIFFLVIMNRDYPDKGQVWGLVGLSLFTVIMGLELVCSFLINRYYLFLLQNRLENETSVAKNMSLNAFSIGPGEEKGPNTDEKGYRANVFAKISYKHFTNGEVRIGVFDVLDWKRDIKIPKRMLSVFIDLMREKDYCEEPPKSIEIKLLNSDDNLKEKKESLLANGFLKVREASNSRELVFRYEPI